jgi:hypothetical protein
MSFISRIEHKIKEGFKSLKGNTVQVTLGDVENVKKTWLNYIIFMTKSSVIRTYLIFKRFQSRLDKDNPYQFVIDIDNN